VYKRQSISVSEPYLENDRYFWIEVKNNSDVPFHLFDGPEGAASSFTLKANSITTVRIDKEKNPELQYKVRNLLTAYEEYLEVVIK
jgi:hypothetical protein